MKWSEIDLGSPSVDDPRLLACQRPVKNIVYRFTERMSGALDRG